MPTIGFVMDQINEPDGSQDPNQRKWPLFGRGIQSDLTHVPNASASANGLGRLLIPSPLLAAILATSFLTMATGLSLVTLDRIKYVLRAPHARSILETVLAAMTGVDWCIVAVTAMVGLAFVAIPAARRGFTALWDGNGTLIWLPMAAALLWFGHAILGRGLIVTGDAGTHVGRVNHLAMALIGGDSLFWDNYFFGGSTLLQFTGPVFHWIAAAADLVVGDATTSVKLVAFSARLAAALFMYLLMRSVGLRRSTAALTSLFYAGAFFVTYMEIIRASFPQMINFAAMPAVLFFLERLLQRPVLFGSGTIGLSLSAILFIGCHQPTALIFGLLVGGYLVVRLAGTGLDIAKFKALAASVLIIGFGSMFFLVPFALERNMTADDFSAASLVFLAWPSLTTLRNFIAWGSAGQTFNYSAYVGLPMLACVVAGGYTICTVPRTAGRTLALRWLLMVALALLSLAVRGAYVREATFTFFFLCAAAGIGLEMLTARVAHPGQFLAAVYLLTLLDAGPLAVQPWTRSDLIPIARAGEALADRARDTRVVEVESLDGKPYVSDDPMLSPLAYSRLQILAGPHKQDATKAHNGFAALLKIVQNDVQRNGRLDPATRTMLAVMNVGWIVGALPNDFADAVTDPTLGAYLQIPEATPFLVSGRLTTMASPRSFHVIPFWDFTFDGNQKDAVAAILAVRDINARMQPNPTTRQATMILVPDRQAGLGWDSDRQGPTPSVRLLSYHVDPGTVHLSVAADGAGFIRLAHPVSLGTHVTLDGTEVKPLADIQSLIVLPLHAGRNDIVVAPVPSVLRRICFWTTIGVLTGLSGAVIVLGVRLHRRAKPGLLA